MYLQIRLPDKCHYSHYVKRREGEEDLTFLRDEKYMQFVLLKSLNVRNRLEG
jgi:hypothetical protein